MADPCRRRGTILIEKEWGRRQVGRKSVVYERIEVDQAGICTAPVG